MAILLSKNIAKCDDRAAVGWAWTGRNLILDEALRGIDETLDPHQVSLHQVQWPLLHECRADTYSRVSNKRPGARIYFQKNASLYGPYLALNIYIFLMFSFKKNVYVCTYWPDSFLERQPIHPI